MLLPLILEIYKGVTNERLDEARMGRRNRRRIGCIFGVGVRLTGEFWIGGFQTGTLLLAGTAAMVFGCFCLLAVLRTNLNAARSSACKPMNTAFSDDDALPSNIYAAPMAWVLKIVY